MNEIRLAWEPESHCDPKLVSDQVRKYMGSATSFAQFPNDACLMLKPIANLVETIEGALREARRLTDFKVYRMQEGDYLVFFAGPLMVYVGKDEFAIREDKIRKRIGALSFPNEHLVPVTEKKHTTDILIGLYARGKLQRDAWQAPKYKLTGMEVK